MLCSTSMRFPRLLARGNSLMVRFNSSSSHTLPPKLATTPNKYNPKSSAFNLKENLPTGFFYHPSPSSLDPEITPKAFLPETDPRKTAEVYYPEEENHIKAHVDSMPIISKARTPKKYHLTREEIEELQKLRNEGVPRRELRAKFGVSDHFINISTEANAETIAKQKKKLEKSVKRWSEKTKTAKTIKLKQEIMWKRDL